MANRHLMLFADGALMSDHMSVDVVPSVADKPSLVIGPQQRPTIPRDAMALEGAGFYPNGLGVNSADLVEESLQPSIPPDGSRACGNERRQL
ncbi:hypothetical protein ColTof4_13400 [Colletotrichum tofieldiae]|nr:hypothetical protein ColTof3_00525 [Colletotrichum tofieldiae]GKT80977.1 hypothetical protein ColTof4_13400 [Colletotrichum tofieldiae]GKT88411.1 hypothetical protein Ct61P_06261 [Colletotrichum tofieldiae]